ncbi:mannitol-1-phosphate 5-dehydrogenase [Cryobacterium psychrophilum]|uniref:Mannitol-1-phosphate 5-dehydrogenase n=1 Tax=Cryobacterium psychrophilum TaxID=41988 RepID=A0A4Y8KRA0_9MICO|nr:mannitol-1-phosphate 5-dehydrogenase [Cryobacterium psychrophilum]TDW29689.1 D-mannitol 1-phosphate 5-dehydrogenase [Cryobacterium psychrophilum]TFD81799.1 mannitol-1-phosphate 5-dehydrogenase [Cryobacterium psychrophilum]
MKAIHFGAGNIGRGFVGLLLHEAGYEVVFADVNSALIDSLQAAATYDVLEQGEGGRTHRVDNFRAINSSTDAEALIDEIATADIVTTAVGPNVLKFVAPVIAAGLARRAVELAPLAVIACENAINATDLLAEQVRGHVTQADWPGVASRAAFANTAVDRIVPNQAADAGTSVTVEAFYEWVIERGAFRGAEPVIPGATFVDDLEPYIERKLFTVNTGHATIAYLGHEAGATSIAEALQFPEVVAVARRVLEETSALLVDKHGLDEDAQRAYREKILTRFSNPALLDTTLRVGRQPLRKLSRTERFIGPAAEIAESGTTPVALLEAIGAALRFAVPTDDQSVELQRMLRAVSAEHVVQQVCGLDPAHPLYEHVVLEVRRAQGL